ncbi:MAG: 2-alkenal reductase, partial [Ectothiorhodospiraceae bacterium]|nr:2-alkenal reductase [Ectothiorhodospiraceae bacterium]
MKLSTHILIAGFLCSVYSIAGCADHDSDPIKENGEATVSTVSASPGDIDKSRRNAITTAVQKVSPAVVGINVTEVRQFRERDPWFRFFFGDRVYEQNVHSLGSGWVLTSDGYIVTNDHVAGNATEIVVTMTGGKQYPARLIGSDPVTDIALIKIETEVDLPYLELGDSEDALVGEWSIAFGNPFGLFATSAKPTVTVGVISAIDVTLEQREGRVYRDMIQTDAAINSGNSGG